MASGWSQNCKGPRKEKHVLDLSSKCFSEGRNPEQGYLTKVYLLGWFFFQNDGEKQIKNEEEMEKKEKKN